MSSEQPASTSPPEFRRYRRFLSWLVLGFVSLGSAYMLVSVGVSIYRRRNAVPTGAPVGSPASPADLQGCLEEVGVVETGARTPPGELSQPARPLRHRRGPALGGERVVLAGTVEGRRRALPLRRAPQGSARQELGGASRDLRRAQEHRSHLHQGTARFRTTPGAAPGSNARAIESRWANASAPPSPRQLPEPHHHDRSIQRTHTSDPSTPPTSESPIEAAAAAAAAAPRRSRCPCAPVAAVDDAQGPVVRRAGPAPRRAARHRGDGLHRPDAGAGRDLAADPRRAAT